MSCTCPRLTSKVLATLNNLSFKTISDFFFSTGLENPMKLTT